MAFNKKIILVGGYHAGGDEFYDGPLTKGGLKWLQNQRTVILVLDSFELSVQGVTVNFAEA